MRQHARPREGSSRVRGCQVPRLHSLARRPSSRASPILDKAVAETRKDISDMIDQVITRTLTGASAFIVAALASTRFAAQQPRWQAS